MAIDPAAVQAVATGLFGALAAFFGYKAHTDGKAAKGAVENLNGYEEAAAKLRKRLNAQNKRLKFLEQESAASSTDREKLWAKVKALESRGA